MKNVFIVDVVDLAASCYLSLKGTRMTNRGRIPLWAVFGGSLVIKKIVSKYGPDYLAFVSSNPLASCRNGVPIVSMGGVSAFPADFHQQLPTFHKLIESYSLPLLTIDGLKVVDIIGSLAARASALHQKTTVVSSNPIFFQLLDDRTDFLNTTECSVENLLVADDTEGYLGVSPGQAVDFMSLTGSSLNGVPGVPGIGRKCGAALIAQYGGIKGIFDNLEAIPNRRHRNGLRDSMDTVWLSHKVLTIATDIDVEFPWAAAEVKPSSLANPELRDFFAATGFRRQAALVQNSMDKMVASAFGEQDAGELACSAAHQEAVTVVALCDWLAAPLSGATLAVQPLFSQSRNDQTLVALAVQIVGGDCQVVRWPQEGGGAQAAELLAKLCEQDRVIVHDLKRLLKLAAWQGTALQSPVGHQPFFDVGIADYLLNPNVNDHGLDRLFSLYLGDQSEVYATLIESGFDSAAIKPLGTAGGSLFQLTRRLHQLAEILATKLSEQGLYQIASDLEIPLTFVLAEMEAEGVFLDAEFLTDYSVELARQLEGLESLIYELAGERFKINSPRQLQTILYEKLDIPRILGIKKLKKVKSGYSTDESQMRLLGAHPLPKAILDYRGMHRIKRAYVDSLPKHVHAATGRVHTHFNQVVAATGRLSSENPNLQNIPKRTPIGRYIRKAFKSQKDGWQIVSADYSQVELRLLAELSGEDALAAAFAEGLDIHASTAQKVFNLPRLADVSSDQRSRAKSVNFGILYGMGASRLAVETGVSVREAEDFIARYFEAFPKIKGYTEELVDRARKLGYAETILGRRRPMVGLNDSNPSIRSRAENTAVNTTIQGSAADLIKAAMIKLARVLKDEKFETLMLLQVHDELVFSSPPSEVESVTQVIRLEMESAITTIVPMTVDIRSGPNWLAAH